MAEPTPKQIADEINTLLDMKPKVRHFSAFGDDNHSAIEAQIRVLEEGLDERDVYGLQDEEGLSQYDVDSALDAVNWLDGEADVPPSDEWKPLVR